MKRSYLLSPGNLPRLNPKHATLLVCSAVWIHLCTAQVVPLSAPANDDFANRSVIAFGTTQTPGDNINATVETGEPTTLSGYVTTSTVWYEWRSPVTGSVTFDTFGSDFDTTLAVFQGSWSSIIVDNDDAGGGVQSEITFPATAGVTYLIQVGGNISASFQDGFEGNLVLNHPMPYPTAVDPGSIATTAQAGDKFTFDLLLQHAGSNFLVYNINTSDPWLVPERSIGFIVPNTTQAIEIEIGPLPASPITGSITFSFSDPGLPDIVIPVDIAFGLFPVDIPDPNLRAALEAVLGLNPGDTISPQDMETLTTFSAPSSGIGNIKGLEFAVNLLDLQLDDNTISDLSPLEDLTSLEFLRLDVNNISDISPLSSMAELFVLFLSDNAITDISVIENMTLLEELYLDSNNIFDISPLANLIDLFDLDLSENYLDLGAGPDLQVVTDLEDFGVFVISTPQKTMLGYNDWIANNGIPAGQDGDSDRNGPYRIPNLLAFGMGINPYTATPADLPAFSYDSIFDEFTVRYYRDISILGAETNLMESTDLGTWSAATPLRFTILSDDGNGRQYVEAVFPNPAGREFYQVGTSRYDLPL